VTSTKGYIRETSEIGTIVRVSPNNQADPLQILISDEDLHPGMPAATYQYILTGTGATIFGIDQRGYLYLNVPHIDADPPNPSTYQLNHPGMPAATYQYILTGTGATIFGIDQRGYLYLNVPHIDADPPNPSTYQLNVSDLRYLLVQ
ncbi:hypothetical protein DICVIV_07216, partial [Dictyocaulus viviparus]